MDLEHISNLFGERTRPQVALSQTCDATPQARNSAMMIMNAEADETSRVTVRPDQKANKGRWKAMDAGMDQSDDQV